MNKLKKFRNGCAKNVDKRAEFLKKFISEDTALNVTKKKPFIQRFVLNFRKNEISNTQIVMQELYNYVKTYKSDDVFKILLDTKNPEIMESLYSKYKECIYNKDIEINYDIIKQFGPTVSELEYDALLHRQVDIIIDSLNLCIERAKAESGDIAALDTKVVDDRISDIYKLCDSFKNSHPNSISSFQSNIVGEFKASLLNSCLNMLVEVVSSKCETWSANSWKIFLESKQNNDFGMGFALDLIKEYREKNNNLSPDIQEVFCEFYKENKKDFAFWNMNSQYADYFISEKIGNRAVEQFLLDEDDSYKCKQINKMYSIATENDIEMYAALVDELIKRQKDKSIDYIDINLVGTGRTSSVIQIGDYVLKCGGDRLKNRIPNHRRILQPIIREKNEKCFFEVADAVDVRTDLWRIDRKFLRR